MAPGRIEIEPETLRRNTLPGSKLMPLCQPKWVDKQKTLTRFKWKHNLWYHLVLAVIGGNNVNMLDTSCSSSMYLYHMRNEWGCTYIHSTWIFMSLVYISCSTNQKIVYKIISYWTFAGSRRMDWRSLLIIRLFLQKI